MVKDIKLWSLRTNVKHHFPDRKLLNDIRALKLPDVSYVGCPSFVQGWESIARGWGDGCHEFWGGAGLGSEKNQKQHANQSNSMEYLRLTSAKYPFLSWLPIDSCESSHGSLTMDLIRGFGVSFRNIQLTNTSPRKAPESRFSIGDDRWWFQPFFLFSQQRSKLTIGKCDEFLMWWLVSPPKFCWLLWASILVTPIEIEVRVLKSHSWEGFCNRI